MMISLLVPCSRRKENPSLRRDIMSQADGPCRFKPALAMPRAGRPRKQNLRSGSYASLEPIARNLQAAGTAPFAAAPVDHHKVLLFSLSRIGSL